MAWAQFTEGRGATALGRDREVAPRSLDRWLASLVQQQVAPAGVGVKLWDGALVPGSPSRTLGDLVVHDRRTLLGLATNPDLCFGQAYTAGGLDVRGPFEPVLEALSRLSAPEPTWRTRLMTAIASPTTLGDARRHVHEHYDLGNDFYAGWLDANMFYTCAYFAQPDQTLEAAQAGKADRVCRKLHLQETDHVVDAGCGWGGFALHAARHVGCRVTAFNVSREQLEFARARARRDGLDHLVSFVDDDYRNITGPCDAFVSLGMLEHVGRRQFDDLARVLARAVRRHGGRGLLHFIGRDVPCPLNAWLRRRIFPGAYAPTLGEVTSDVLAPAGMSVADVENLRLHCARTLAHWSERYEASVGAVRTERGNQFARAWSLYLAGSQAAFASGWLQLYQVVFSPRESDPPWWTRDDALVTPERPA